MLLSLSIRNIVLIDSLNIEFDEGFSVLTGETGAGKSILLDSLGLTLGKRSEARLVSQGQTQGSVTAEFDIKNNQTVKNIIEDNDLPLEDSLLIRRVVSSDGKSKAFVNDTPVGLNLLQEIAANIVEIHGQHDQLGLLSPIHHMKILDSYGNLESQVNQVSSLYRNWQESSKNLQEMKAKAEKARAEEEYLRHALAELEELSPEVGEEKELSESRALMMNSEKIIDALKSAISSINGDTNVTDALRDAERVLDRNRDKAEELFEPAIEALDRAGVEVNEAISVIEDIAQRVTLDQDDLGKTEERLFALRAAARKYDKTVDELKEYKSSIANELDLISSNDDQIEKLAKEVEENRSKYLSSANELSVKRKKVADKLEKSLVAELSSLKMGNSKFKVDIKELDEDKFSANGIDKIEFLVSTNPGSPFGSINKIASGGELSRFMLALKVVLSGVSMVPTVIFDEIDVGVGGAVADAVGSRLSALSENIQVMCVTHQPQVASYGVNHYLVEKNDKSGKLTTKVTRLSEESSKEEVARMLSGAVVSDEARAAAGKLMRA